ncbi:MAG: STN domain-containing protein [Gammaproteobacteria bacterium]
MSAVVNRSCTGLAVALGLVWACLFQGGVRGAEPTGYTLHIASQPLDSALQDFARQTGIQIIFFSRLTDGYRAPALDGTYSVDAAMKALLADSKLTFRRVNAKTIEIEPSRRRTDRTY